MALTVQLEHILEEMNRGIYLIKMEHGESLSTNGYNSMMSVKSGSIDALVEEGLVYKSHLATKVDRYILTDEGRKYRKLN